MQWTAKTLVNHDKIGSIVHNQYGETAYNVL